MFDIKPPVDEHELREMLLELDLHFDDAIFPQMLVAVQPMRAKLRAGGEGTRRALLRGAAISAGRVPPRTGSPGHPVAVADDPPGLRPTLRHLVARLGTLWLAMVTALFAVMTMQEPAVGMFFGCITAALLFIAITGRGLGGQIADRAVPASVPDAARRGASPVSGSLIGTVIVIVLLYVTGIANLLVLAVRSVFDPRFHAEGDAVTRAMQVVGLLVLFIVGSHLVRRARD